MSTYNQDFWNGRFATGTYVFGTEPSVFLKEQAGVIPPGARVLVPADGEGRNSVYLAGLGHDVTATDIAGEGIAKARRLAEAKGASVDFRQADVHSWDWPQAEYDAVVAIFIQFSPPHLREIVFAGMKQAVRPGGLILLHGYTPKQLDYRTGGPSEVDHLYTDDMLRAAFTGWEMLRIQSYERELDEGPGHKGLSALIDLVARKLG